MQGLAFLQSPAGQGYAFLGSPLVQDGLGGDVHIIVRPGARELLRQLDAALKDLIDDGTHERLTRKHFPFSIL
jgi:ABC-type amino acid transport substrate-binding protein